MLSRPVAAGPCSRPVSPRCTSQRGTSKIRAFKIDVGQFSSGKVKAAEMRRFQEELSSRRQRFQTRTPLFSGCLSASGPELPSAQLDCTHGPSRVCARPHQTSILRDACIHRSAGLRSDAHPIYYTNGQGFIAATRVKLEGKAGSLPCDRPQARAIVQRAGKR